jgi:hypothetical protein
MKIRLFTTLAVLVLLQVASSAQGSAGWPDNLVDRMAGTWKSQGQVMEREAHHEVQAEWVLNHQYLRIQEKTAAGAPDTERRYEAIWYLGYDSVSERYVLLLMDVFGARFSETLGYGVREGNQIRFTFEYPDGPFHTIFRWNPDSDTWEWLMEQKDKNGKWTSFADLKLSKVGTH